jgi:hypothetical protein
MSKKKNNIQKVSEMLDGTFTGFKTQVGYEKETVHRKVGDRWIDSDGKEWEQHEGFYSSVKKMPSVGIFDKVCKDCGTNCGKKNGDKRHYDTWMRMNRCFYCQIDFEAVLHTKGEWEDWVKDQEIKRWDEIFKDLEELEKEKKSKKIFDKSVANAMANANVSMEIKKNKG